MFNRTRIYHCTPKAMCLLRCHIDNPSPEALVIAPDVAPHAFALASDVSLVDAFLISSDICRNRRLLSVEEELMYGIGEFRMSVGYMPKHPQHSTDTARTKDFDSRRTLVGRSSIYWHSTWRLWYPKDVTEKCEEAHGVISCQSSQLGGDGRVDDSC